MELRQPREREPVLERTGGDPSETAGLEQYLREIEQLQVRIEDLTTQLIHKTTQAEDANLQLLTLAQDNENLLLELRGTEDYINELQRGGELSQLSTDESNHTLLSQIQARVEEVRQLKSDLARTRRDGEKHGLKVVELERQVVNLQEELKQQTVLFFNGIHNLWAAFIHFINNIARDPRISQGRCGTPSG